MVIVVGEVQTDKETQETREVEEWLLQVKKHSLKNGVEVGCRFEPNKEGKTLKDSYISKIEHNSMKMFNLLL